MSQQSHIIGKSHYEIFPEIPNRWKEIHRKFLAGAVEKCQEDPFPRADGTTDWVKWESHPWRTDAGEIGVDEVVPQDDGAHTYISIKFTLCDARSVESRHKTLHFGLNGDWPK